MIVKVNCESDRIESPDQVAALFAHGVLIGTPRAVDNPNAQNGITFVIEMLYEYGGYMAAIIDADAYCAARGQDCIAEVIEGTGVLYGPRSARWLPFNPAYFIE